MYISRIIGIINLLLILTIIISIILKYAFNINVDVLIFFQTLLLILGAAFDVIALSIYKEWQIKEARFGLIGTLARITVGMVIIFGLMYLIVNYLPLPN